MKNVIDILTERGLIDQMTSPELKEHARHPIKVYIGFDPTAESLHLGNLVAIVALSWFQKCGHTPYALIGGATGRVGDPSGKSIERPQLSEAELKHNVLKLTQFLEKVLTAPVVVNNEDWLSKFTLIDFLQDVGRFFRVGPMLAKESVRARLQSEEGLSFTEFSYQLLQGYDFHYLNQKFGVTLQMGGSDQWGNITAGTEFNRKLKGAPLFGLTFPLLTRSDGKKFGKSEEGAIWLSKEMLSPYKFYQHLYGIPDADVVRLLKMLTFLDLAEIDSIERGMANSPNSAQKRLAEEVTRFIHGEEGLAAALNATAGSMGELSADTLREIQADMPHVSLALEDVLGKKFVDLALEVGLIPSKGEGVRLIKNGGAYLNNEKIEDPSFQIEKVHLIDGRYLLLGSGKKKKILIEIAGSQKIDLKNNR
jgi:tyrosyl-tRNA synthetase